MKMRDLEFSKALGKRACLYTRRCHGSRNCRAEVIRSAFRFRLAKMSEIGHSLPAARRRAGREVRSGPKADLIPTPWLMLLASLTEEHDHAGTSERDPRAP